MKVDPTGITISFGGTPKPGDEQRSVVARIIGYSKDNDDEPVQYDVVVPAGESVKQSLPEGLYSVQLTLSSGRIIQRSVKIDQDSHEVFRFYEDVAPSAGFSLQESVRQQVGDILADSAAASGNSSAADYDDARQRAADLARAGTHNPNGRPGIKAFRPSPPVEMPIAPSPATLTYREGPLDSSASGSPGSDGWSPVAPLDAHGDSALWRIAGPNPAPATLEPRRWARVALPGGAVELASLPLPWLDTRTEQYSAADVLVDPARRGGTATTVAIKDSALAGLLSFLDRGQATAAGPLLAEFERDDVIAGAILTKMSNPLAACAAAYVGLAVYPPTEHEQWDMWLENCMALFPSVPDAAIVHARRLVLRPTSVSDNDRAAAALRAASAAGVPYFSAGVFLLRDMLVLLSTSHADLAPLAQAAGVLASRVDATQAFTVLRYAASKETPA